MRLNTHPLHQVAEYGKNVSHQKTDTSSEKVGNQEYGDGNRNTGCEQQLFAQKKVKSLASMSGSMDFVPDYSRANRKFRDPEVKVGGTIRQPMQEYKDQGFV